MKLDRYETLDVISEGGTSVVYRGRELLTHRDVAIKILRMQQGVDAINAAARFQSEARIAARLQHPSIVSVLDTGSTPESRPYLVMEFVQGRSLAEYLGRLTVEQVPKALRGIASGLDYAHQNGVVHRDVKPSNLLLTELGDPKILDFGTARLVATTESRITQQGIVVGTPYYLSPEQVSGGHITGAADQFALAIVSFELLTGTRPYGGDTMLEVMTAILMQSPSDAQGLNLTLGAECMAVFRRALSKEPANRFTTCSDFIHALVGALERTPSWCPFQAHFSSDPEGSRAQRPESVRMRTQFDLPVTVGMSTLQAPPTNFSFTQAFPAGPFFQSGEVHFQEIRSKVKFYQDQLTKEYDQLLKQMRTTYILWLIAVSGACAILFAGVVLLLMHQTTSGAITSASSTMLYFLQRVFQQREDTYRKAAEDKQKTLEYGNQWALAIQSIQAMEDSRERVLREKQLVQSLIDHLGDKFRRTTPKAGRGASLQRS